MFLVLKWLLGIEVGWEYGIVWFENIKNNYKL